MVRKEQEEYLTLKDVTLLLDNKLILDRITFSVHKQEIISVIGPNGAGKSTIFNIITGITHPSRGEIYFKGLPITYKEPYEICHLGISRTFQISRPFPSMTALENVMIAIMFGKPENRKIKKEILAKRAMELLDMVGIGEKGNTVARCLTLSEQRRLEVARAMATNPELLLLDEFAAGLSPKAIDNALNLIEKLRKRGLTLLIIDHFLNVTARISDRIIAIDKGKIIAEGSVSEVLTNPVVASSYLGTWNEAI